MTNHLIFDRCYINGAWVDSNDKKHFSIIAPATEEPISEIPDCNSTDANNAIESAYLALQPWQNLSFAERSDRLTHWFDLIKAHRADLAHIVMLESGKPLSEAEVEVDYAASFVSWFAAEALRIEGKTLNAPHKKSRLIVQKKPCGVCVAITPWNFPLAMITRKLAPALAAGCTIVLKPAEETPLSALALASLAEKAGILPGVINVITASDGEQVGKTLCSHTLTRKITFTGSTEVGQIILSYANKNICKVSMELGGNAPFVVFKSADLDKVMIGIDQAKFRNAGQTCIAANRFFVATECYDEFINKLLIHLRKQYYDEKNLCYTLSPLINAAAVEKNTAIIKTALSEGAECLLGGSKIKGKGYYVEPTVLSSITDSMKIFHQEIFGPIISIILFCDKDSLVEQINNTPFGLAAYLFSNDINEAWDIADQLDFAMVGINDAELSMSNVPFGGMKRSGIGREGGKEGIEAFLETQYLCIGK